MDTYRLVVWLHIVLGIVLAGQALFWMVMLTALVKQFGRHSAESWLRDARSARWPHVVVPYSLRLPLPAVAWITLAVLGLTGWYLLLHGLSPAGPLWQLKLALAAFLVLVQLVLALRAVPAFIVLNLLTTLALMVVSALTIRG